MSDSNYIMHKRKIYESGSRRHDVQRNRIKLHLVAVGGLLDPPLTRLHSGTKWAWL